MKFNRYMAENCHSCQVRSWLSHLGTIGGWATVISPSFDPFCVEKLLNPAIRRQTRIRVFFNALAIPSFW